MADKLTFPMNPKEYSRYCRAWWFYLDMTEKERHRFLTPLVSDHIKGITKWPTITIETTMWFDDDVDTFVCAVESVTDQVNEARKIADENRRAIADAHFKARREAAQRERERGIL